MTEGFEYTRIEIHPARKTAGFFFRWLVMMTCISAGTIGAVFLFMEDGLVPLNANALGWFLLVIAGVLFWALSIELKRMDE